MSRRNVVTPGHSSSNQGFTIFCLGVLVSAGVAQVIRIIKEHRRHSGSFRRRITHRLDAIAPSQRYNHFLILQNQLINTECPVCLCTFTEETKIRLCPCRHACCDECLKSWVVHAAHHHLRRGFTFSSGGQLVAYAPGPRCPLCKESLEVIHERDFAAAVLVTLRRRADVRSLEVQDNHIVAVVEDRDREGSFGEGSSSGGNRNRDRDDGHSGAGPSGF